MNDKDDSAWVFDSLIGFLQGPIWSSPLLTFIEEKSLGLYTRWKNRFHFSSRHIYFYKLNFPVDISS